MHGPPLPHFRPSYAVHISPTRTEFGPSTWNAPNYWIAEGLALETILGMLYDFEPMRIDFQDRELATERYDVAMVPPIDIGEKAIKEAIRTALLRELGLLSIRDVRRRDVYVVTAPDGLRPEFQEAENTGACVHLGAGGISMRCGTIEQFCSMLERDLDRPIIDETNLQGRYSFTLMRGMKTQAHFLEQMQKEVGLVVSSAERDVAMLLVRAR